MPTTVRTAQGSGIALAIIVTCQLMLMIDATIVNIALPRMAADLDIARTDLSWVVNAYILAFGGLLLLGGRAGDILGRRRMFVAGIAVFTAASLLGGFAPSSGWLLAARALQGLGAAFAAPGTYALIAGNFAEGGPRDRAISILTAATSGGSAVGLILGGVLTDWASWRWVMFINVPIGLFIVALAPRRLAETERHTGRFDLTGALTSTLGMTSLVYALIRVSSAGWSDGQALGGFALGVVLLAVFVAVERRAPQPIMPLRLLADRERAGAYLNMLLVPAAGISMFFFMAQYLEDVRGYSALVTGLAFLPLVAGLLVASRFAPRLLARYGVKPLAATGLAVVTIALTWLSQADPDSHVIGVLLPMVAFGTGMGFTFVPLTSKILSGTTPQDAGAASGLMQALQQTGGSLGLAILTTIFAAATAGHGTAALAEGISAAVGATALFTGVAIAITLAARSRPYGVNPKD
ncbi:MFS transporter [Nonomuraea sp. M3C6]|uniref:MFS transporter n=1 Tax=Nonomuraea marmarensis TaxID=3351344 RepID=A0ABW7AI12_9ACTN